jgi:Ca2+-dependent lipid-binding protein|tara:strand:+ start:570 stop:752 length:183 start_codon:yes stop_codon:yes gene_type:complete
MMRISIYQAESLPPADSTGTSDPYVEVWTPNKEKIVTRTVNDTNNPIYYQVLEIPFEFTT